MNKKQFMQYRGSCCHFVYPHKYPKGYCGQYKGECEFEHCFAKNMVDGLVEGKYSLWIEARDIKLEGWQGRSNIEFYVEGQPL